MNFKKFLYRLTLVRLNFFRRVRSFFLLSRQTQPPKNILIGGVVLLGDLVLIAPLFQALKQEFPGASLSLLVPHGWARFAKCFKNIDHVFEAQINNPTWLKNFRCTHPKNKWDLGVVPWAYHLIPLFYALGVKQIRAFPDPKNRRAYQIHQKINLPQIASHFSQMTLELSSSTQTSYPAPHFNLDLIEPSAFLSAEDQNRYVIIHPGASTATRIWDLENYIAIAEYLKTKLGYKIILTGISTEKILTAKILQKAPFCLDLAGKTKPHELLALLKYSKLVIGPDTGVLHIARALNIPSITLMGPTPIKIYGPNSNFHDLTISKALYLSDLPCRDVQTLFKHKITGVDRCNRKQCLHPETLCMTAFSSQNLLKTIHELLTP